MGHVVPQDLPGAGAEEPRVPAGAWRQCVAPERHQGDVDGQRVATINGRDFERFLFKNEENVGKFEGNQWFFEAERGRSSSERG